MTKIAPFGALALALAFGLAAPAHAEEEDFHAFSAKSLDGKDVDLGQYRGKVVLVVNTASKCGLTPHYKGLQALYEKYGKQGLVVLGFPCNQFGGQEPGTAEEIRTFCTERYQVTFPRFAKVDVNGPGAIPVYKYLTGKHGGKIKWNFTKFLISPDGKQVTRFEPGTKPESKQIVQAIEAALAKLPKTPETPEKKPASRPSK
jgi:glutathione peroxidase